jgi:hypothetical protein
MNRSCKNVSRPAIPKPIRQTVNTMNSLSLTEKKLLLECRTRRHFFRDCGLGLGAMALADLAGASQSVSQPAQPHYQPKAKNVIYLFMAGAPSQLDLFDEKPELRKLEGKPLPRSVIGEQRFAFIDPDAGVLSPRFDFAQYGQSGARLSSVLPHLREVVDDIAIIKGMHTDQFNHAPAQIFLNTGSPQLGRPSMGSWAVYGLGSESRDLPGFVVLNSGGGLSGGAACWSSGFMPSVYAGVPFRSEGDPILSLSNPPGVSRGLQGHTVDLVNRLNRMTFDHVGDPEILTRIENYEKAFRMQTSGPELADLSSESKETLAMYGISGNGGSFARNCLLARRLIERGTRFVQLYHVGWDHHSNVEGGLKSQCAQTDQASAALIKDLKQRGMLEDTLVIWGGEFGRTAMVEASAALGRSAGRDHHPHAFTIWMAGGGIRSGITVGQTDELGYYVVEDPVHIHDLQATILHLLGLDHERLTYRFKGRDFRLTDVHGRVFDRILS